MNKTQAILKHLQRGRTITSVQAFEKFGATRLAAIIFNLREKGYNIITIECDGVDRFGEPVRYAKYKLIEG